jgi:hypothetical protein
LVQIGYVTALELARFTVDLVCAGSVGSRYYDTQRLDRPRALVRALSAVVMSLTVIGHQAGEAVLPILFVAATAWIGWGSTWPMVARFAASRGSPSHRQLDADRASAATERWRGEAGRRTSLDAGRSASRSDFLADLPGRIGAGLKTRSPSGGTPPSNPNLANTTLA